MKWKAETMDRGIKHSVPPGAAHEHTVETLKGRHWDHQLAAAYRSQLKARTQLNDEFLQEFAAAIEEFTHWALVSLPEYYIIRRQAVRPSRG
jgi:hypothetical protein